MGDHTSSVTGGGQWITVDDAIRAGKTHLELRCEPCRVIKQIPWRLLPGVLGSHRLADVAAHLICERCKTRPDPTTVKPRAQSDAQGYATKVY